MSSPIKAGDLCEVISGVLKENSPNLGLIVKVLAYVGDAPVFGRIWRCEAQYAEMWHTHPDADQKVVQKLPPGQADFAQAWLKKIEPPAQTDTKTITRTKETES